MWLLQLGLGLLVRPRVQVLNAGLIPCSAAEALDFARGGNFTALSKAEFVVPESELAARAFWINLYNALTLHAMAVVGVKQSVLESIGFFDRFAYTISGQNLTLSQIEHGVLRGNKAVLGGKIFAASDARASFVLPLDARVHFALNCGALSCPPIRAYQAEKLDSQLEMATHAYLQDARVMDNTVWLPRLFSYYRTDFGAVLEFARRYRVDIPAQARVRFLPYSWRVTKLPSQFS